MKKIEEESKNAIALFRYAMIAPVLTGSIPVQTRYFKELAQKEHEVPLWGRRRYREETFKRWLRQYRGFGFQALVPKQREDKGQSRKIDSQLAATIRDTVAGHPFMPVSALYRKLVSDGWIQMGTLTEGTLRKYIRDNKLKQEASPQPRKKFEKEHVNEMWVADCMHGPYLKLEGNKKKHKVFLIAAIDDHSRMICARGWFAQENASSLEISLKQGMARYGLPKTLYCDNGAIFVTGHLQMACARLGIALIHSKPYDSPSRGKIERFFRTVRDKFLSLLDTGEINSLELLNQRFERWLDKEYHRHMHSGINQTPMQRFLQDSDKTTIKKASNQELDHAFYVTVYRKVKNDSTVSVANTLYECPPQYIGHKIEIRYPSDNPGQLTIYQEDKAMAQLRELQIHQNANTPAAAIKFDQNGDEGGAA